MELALTEQSSVAVDENGLSQCVRGNGIYEPDTNLAHFPPRRLAAGGLRALVAAPLLIEAKTFGVLIAARREPRSFGGGEWSLAAIERACALAAHQAKL